MSPRYLCDAPSSSPSPLKPAYRLTSRKSFSSQSPSSSSESSPRNRARQKRDTHHLIHRLLWTALSMGLLLFSLLQWTTQSRPFPRLESRTSPMTIDSIASKTTVPPSAGVAGDVVQVIQTRFMQQQPHLVDLGMARLEIFKALSLPTVVGQTLQDFLWIIRTDPLLNATIRQRLQDLLQGHDNYLLVASNANPEGFREKEAIGDINRDAVWSGSYELLQRYHEAAQSHVVLESRLDADDGIHLRFVEYMQLVAPKFLNVEKSWMVWCASSHLEWHYNSPFPGSTENVEYGFLLGIKNEECVTPGLTMAYGLGASRADLPRGTHQFLHKILPECSDQQATNCLHRFWELKPGALRARTPTSAGMAHLVEEGNNQKLSFRRGTTQAQLQGKMWNGAEIIFGISRQEIVHTKHHVVENLAAIAADNLKGQCTRGHSCKQEAKVLLKRILDHVEGEDVA